MGERERRWSRGREEKEEEVECNDRERKVNAMRRRKWIRKKRNEMSLEKNERKKRRGHFVFCQLTQSREGLM